MKKDGIQSNTVDKFNKLVTNKFNRVGYIYRPKGKSASKFLTSRNYLSDELIKGHISNEQTIGGKIAENRETGDNFTSVLMFDLDAPEAQTDYFVNIICKEILQVEAPSYSFVNEKNGHEYHYIYLDKTIPYNYIRTLSTLTRTDLTAKGIKPIDIKPDRAGVRLMFGGSYNMVDAYSQIPIAPQDHQAEIEIAYDLFESGNMTVASTAIIRENIGNAVKRQEAIEQAIIELDYEVITPSNNFYVTGEFWEEIEKLETKGLTAPSTRNKAQMQIVYACVHRGLTEQQTIGYIIQEWLPKFHNGQSKDYKRAVETKDYSAIRAEIRSAYRWAVRTYKPGQAKRTPEPLTPEETQALYEYALTLTTPDGLKPKQRQKVFKLLEEIAQLYKTVGSNNIVAISHSLFDKWGFSQRKAYRTKTGEIRALFSAVDYLKEKGAIRPIFNRSYIKVCQRYSLQFLKTTPRIFKSIATGKKQQKSKGIELRKGREGKACVLSLEKPTVKQRGNREKKKLAETKDKKIHRETDGEQTGRDGKGRFSKGNDLAGPLPKERVKLCH